MRGWYGNVIPRKWMCTLNLQIRVTSDQDALVPLLRGPTASIMDERLVVSRPLHDSAEHRIEEINMS